jgi:hypothetical protein
VTEEQGLFRLLRALRKEMERSTSLRDLIGGDYVLRSDFDKRARLEC